MAAAAKLECLDSLQENDTPPQLTFSPSLVARWLLWIAGTTAAASFILRLVGIMTHHMMNRKLDLDSELSFPAYFSAALLLTGAILFWFIGVLVKHRQGPYSVHWRAAGSVFALMSIDEAIALHEPMGEMLRERLGTSGVLYFAWVIPGIAFVLLFFAAFAKFLTHLPIRTRILLVVSAAVYLSGCVGFELIGGSYAEKHGLEDLTYTILTTIEETLEMGGSILLIYTLLDYIKTNFNPTQLSFGGRVNASAEGT